MDNSAILEVLLPAARRVDEAIALFYERDKSGLRVEVRAPLYKVLTTGGGVGAVKLNNGRLKRVGGELITLKDKISLNGYGDDDVLIDLICAWAEARGWVALEPHSDLVENGANLYLDHRYLVWACYKRYSEGVLPSLRGARVGFHRMNSIGPVGPVPNDAKEHAFKLSIAQVLAVMEQEFIARSDLWLDIFHAVWVYGYSDADFYDGQLLRDLACEIADTLSEAFGKVDGMVGEMFLGLTAVTVNSKGLSFTEAAYASAGALTV